MTDRAEQFPKTERVLKRGEFRAIYDGGRKIQARHFTAFVRRQENGPSRLGITSTRKVGNSVERNRARAMRHGAPDERRDLRSRCP